jgi:hypothetical protein
MLDMTDTDLYFTADEIAPLTANGSYINTDLPEIEWLNGGQPHEDFEDFEDFDEFNEFEGDFDYAGEFHNDDD